MLNLLLTLGQMWTAEWILNYTTLKFMHISKDSIHTFQAFY
jgi:hypothetical protein